MSVFLLECLDRIDVETVPSSTISRGNTSRTPSPSSYDYSFRILPPWLVRFRKYVLVGKTHYFISGICPSFRDFAITRPRRPPLNSPKEDRQLIQPIPNTVGSSSGTNKYSISWQFCQVLGLTLLIVSGYFKILYLPKTKQKNAQNTTFVHQGLTNFWYCDIVLCSMLANRDPQQVSFRRHRFILPNYNPL